MNHPQSAADKVPAAIRKKFSVLEWRHATAILKADFESEWDDIIAVLEKFELCKTHIDKQGGSKSEVAGTLDSALEGRGWQEKKFDTVVQVDGREMESPTHKVDCFKNGVALEIEWNNKDPFFDRDLNNFRLLFDLRAISVGVIVTRSDELQDIFRKLGRYKSFGASTTHMSKLLPRIEGGGGGGCPILVFGIKPDAYNENC